MKMSKRRQGSVGVAALAVALAACGRERPQSNANDVEAVAGAVVASSALPSSFRIDATTYFENTARVVPPSVKPATNCPNGGISVQTGQSPASKFLFRPLFNPSSGGVDVASTTTTLDLPGLVNDQPATDAQMVRLADGSLLAVKTGLTWGTPASGAPVSYALENIFSWCCGTKQGDRGSYFVFRSTDCGASWNMLTKLDFATWHQGRHGYPTPVVMVDGVPQPVAPSMPPHDGKTWAQGGGDRHELYACPFTKNIYMTAQLNSGKYYKDPAAPDAIHAWALVMSQDGGQTWTVLTESLSIFVPVVMTSTPDGRLFLFGMTPSNQPLVQFSQPMGVGGTPMLGPAYDASFVDTTGLAVPAGRSSGGLPGFMIVSDQNTSKALNAFNGAREGGPLQFNTLCASTNPDCAWSYQKGMIVSARRNPTGPLFALNAPNVVEGGTVQLTAGCTAGNPQCTWTYKQGLLFSDQDKSLALRVSSDGSLALTRGCAATNSACTFTMQHVPLSFAANPGLGVNAYGGAGPGVALKLSSNCTRSNPDCTWTFTHGLIESDKNLSLKVAPVSGAFNGRAVALQLTCPQTDPTCTWTWTHGELMSDGSTTPLLAMRAAATEASPLHLDQLCSSTNFNCLFNGPYPSADAPTQAFTPSISRISTDTTTSKVRLVYSSINTANMQIARIVTFDANDPTHPTPVTSIGAADSGTHSVMFTTFIDPDYQDMPGFIKSNKAVLYWQEVPSTTAADHTFSMRYALVTGDANVAPAQPLSVNNGALQTWTTRTDLGDYVGASFFWSGKALSYFTHWVEPAGIQANVVTATSEPGFIIRSDASSSLLVNAINGARDGGPVALHDQCTISNPDCTWSYQRGMIVSDSDPRLAMAVGANPAAGDAVTLSSTCARNNPSCTWTYKQGQFLSDRNQTLAIRASNPQVATALTLSSTCGTSLECKWTLPNVLIMIDRDSKLALNAIGGAANGSPVSVHDQCSLGNPDCTWTLQGGVITSDRDASLRVRAMGGAVDGSSIKLSNDCSQIQSCRWTWSKGELISDNSGATPLPLNAWGGAVVGAPFVITSLCTASNPDCLFSGLFGR